MEFKYKFRNAVEETRRRLLQGVDADVQNGFGWTALHYAASHGHEAVVPLLLAGGAHLNCVTNYGQTPLHFAAGEGHVQVVRVLLEASAEHAPMDIYGKTPLHNAIRFNHQPCIDLLATHAALNPPLAPLSPPVPVEQPSDPRAPMARPTPLDMRRFCPVRDLHPMIWQHLSPLDREMIRCAQNSARPLPVVDQVDEDFVYTCIEEGSIALLQMALE